MKKLVALLILIGCLAFSCERDDICTLDTVTTPRLTIAFYSIENPEQQNPRNVARCRVQGIGNDETLPDLDGSTSKQIILLPLKTTENSTQYSIYKNYRLNNNQTPDNPDDDFITGNEDIITISYVTEEVYVSRACGFKTVFKNISMTVEDDGDKWIKIIQSVDDNQTIENENATNYNLYH
ncbi:hypothetical protein SAMN04487989_104206 [Bizionia echini]|uniref:Uncharacterized protein n=1 Tax=Bizionia echini TaxID=649333 RepID=A0A1I5C566_9FLAO|nr:DUF6452 family protein [Bizionia echini]SFN82004.1 hypothetical protein SAMN04487989_104206 [Bizionia echini]